MKQNSAGKISMKKAFLIPMAAAMGITMAAPAFAGRFMSGIRKQWYPMMKTGTRSLR